MTIFLCAHYAQEAHLTWDYVTLSKHTKERCLKAWLGKALNDTGWVREPLTGRVSIPSQKSPSHKPNHSVLQQSFLAATADSSL